VLAQLVRQFLVEGGGGEGRKRNGRERERGKESGRRERGREGERGERKRERKAIEREGREGGEEGGMRMRKGQRKGFVKGEIIVMGHRQTEISTGIQTNPKIGMKSALLPSLLPCYPQAVLLIISQPQKRTPASLSFQKCA
jgi:hypothetical protein